MEEKRVPKFERYFFPVCLADSRPLKEVTTESGCRCRSSLVGASSVRAGEEIHEADNVCSKA